ncbi:odorant receptor 13a-like [Solenopsis invicta]|uniref:odorant receptor 13a-like n=1 Tax=Solenopsis invicta TaxID=13686 RepID=UPI00193D516E|nr:odorant receptor 13a-like [Solenopsis invicta]
MDADKEYDDLIKHIKRMGKFISIWPLERDPPTNLIAISVAVTVDLVRNINDLDNLTACALMASTTYLSIIRLTVFSTHQKDMLYVVETMKKDWVCSSYEDKAFLKEKCLFAFRVAKCFLIMVTITTFFFGCSPVLEFSRNCLLPLHKCSGRTLTWRIVFRWSFRFTSLSKTPAQLRTRTLRKRMHFLGKERMFPCRGYFFANQMVSPFYELLYVFNIMAAVFSSSTIMGATTFNFVAVTHGSVKFALLRRKLELINNNDPDVDGAMVDCIKDHQDAITFADTLERIVNILTLAQFVISSGMLCFAGFQITAMVKNEERLMQYIMYLSAAILELFMFSFSGNLLIDESNAVGESAYCSCWIGSTFGRSLQIVMMRSKVPSKITAAKFYSMSLESFARVLSASFSYIMVLLSRKEH